MKLIFIFSFYLIIIILILPKDSFSQKKDSLSDWTPGIKRFTEKQWGITGGINAGKYVTANLGIAHGISEQGFEIWSLSAIGINAELLDPKRNAYGFGAEAWFNAYISMGIAAVDYTDFTLSRYCLRPMFGTGFGNWRINYGYNIRLNKNDYKIFNTHMFILNYFFPISHKSKAKLERKM